MGFGLVVIRSHARSRARRSRKNTWSPWRTVSRIRRLSAGVASRIAAGEVVERPASVVKELAENSLDSGAKRIDVRLKGGGSKEISVRDDGCGIHRDDAEAAFERYSTSKIDSVEDLRTIATLGFRGEALAAIAAAAGEVELVTCTGPTAGVRVVRDDGNPTKRTEASGPRGTLVIVRRLFAGLPARRKFLKSARAESALALDVVVREALARPEVAFSFDDDGERRLATPGRGLASAMAAAYGANSVKELLPLDSHDGDVRLSGLVSPPHLIRRTSEHITVAVNGRPVENPELKRAVRDGYRGSLPDGAWPLAVVHISVPPERVDVNVHPRKLEVKVEPVKELVRVVSEAVRKAVMESPRALEFRVPKRGAGSAETSPRPGRRSGLGIVAATAPDYPTAPAGPSFIARDSEASLPGSVARRQSTLATGTAARARTETREGAVRVISQMFRTFFLAERGDEFWLVDQHTAHERVLYERLLGKGTPRPQRLVEPALVELGAAERRILDSNLQELEALGFQIEPFGSSTVKVGAVPSVFGRPTAAGRLRDILDDLAEGAKLKDVDGRAERVRKSSACRSAWMKGDEVAPEEFAPVLKELLECRDPYRCPHGRPTIITLSRDWFEREFERK